MYQLSVDHLVVSEVKTGSERLENIKKKKQQNTTKQHNGQPNYHKSYSYSISQFYNIFVLIAR